MTNSKEAGADKREIWIGRDGDRVEVYGSSYSIGSKHSLLGRSPNVKVRPIASTGESMHCAAFGINGWASRDDARDFLVARGYVRAERA